LRFKNIYHSYFFFPQDSAKEIPNLSTNQEVQEQTCLSQEGQIVTKYLEQYNCSDVNECVEGLINDAIDGPILLLPIHNHNFKTVKLLVKNFNSNINQEIFIEGKQSTMLIHSIRRCLE